MNDERYPPKGPPGGTMLQGRVKGPCRFLFPFAVTTSLSRERWKMILTAIAMTNLECRCIYRDRRREYYEDDIRDLHQTWAESQIRAAEESGHKG
jgi:hypothetical protein